MHDTVPNDKSVSISEIANRSQRFHDHEGTLPIFRENIGEKVIGQRTNLTFWGASAREPVSPWYN